MYGRELWRIARSFLRSRRLTVPAVVSISLGISASTILFSVVKGVLLTPLPYPDAERLVLIRARNTRAGETRPFVSVLDFRDWQRQTSSFDGMALYGFRQLDLPGEAGTERVQGLVVTPEFYDVMGLSAVAGELPDTRSEAADTDVILLGRHLWNRRFGADPTLVGETVAVNSWTSLPRLGSIPHQVVAVIDEPARFPPMTAGLDQRFVGVDDFVDFWLPLRRNEEILARRGLRDSYGAVARLARGVTWEQAEAELEAVAARLAERYPDTNTNWSVEVVPLSEAVVGGIRPVAWLLSAGVGLLLLISCGNVASLQLVRTIERREELALRVALGASTLRLLGHLVTQTWILVMLGGAVGVGLAAGGIRWLETIAPAQLPRVDTIELDGGVLLFALVLTTVVGLLTGCVPAWLATRTRHASKLDSASQSTSASRKSRRLLESLASISVGMALVLLIGTGLIHQSLARLLAVDPGFDRQSLLTLTVSLPEAKYAWRRNTEFLRAAIARLETLPGVTAVGAVRGMPGNETRIEAPILLPDRLGGPRHEQLRAQIRVVTPGYFEAMSVPILAGRGFEPRDELGEIGYTNVVLVNQTMADRIWPGESAIGKKIGVIRADLPLMEIVGVVGDVRYRSLENAPGLEIYYPEALFPQPRTDLVIRTETPPLGLATAVAAELRAAEPDVLITGVRSMERALHETVEDRHFVASLLKGFSLTALILSVVGVGGVMSRNVALRRQELGVRIALGARAGRIMRLVLEQSFIVTGVGIILGLVGSVAGMKLLNSFLYAIEPTDPITYLATSLMTAAAALFASLFAARSAARTDPLDLLRRD